MLLFKVLGSVIYSRQVWKVFVDWEFKIDHNVKIIFHLTRNHKKRPNMGVEMQTAIQAEGSKILMRFQFGGSAWGVRPIHVFAYMLNKRNQFESPNSEQFYS